ncbi:MAG: hypothetical protein Q4A00_08030, partial [Flavobacteriaceae bacterium]|nr:hypothetical protein [Flavobacteriaceae bacterium]
FQPLVGKWLTVIFRAPKKYQKNKRNSCILSKKYLYLCRTITKKDKTMEKTTDTPPDKPMRLANRTGGAA